MPAEARYIPDPAGSSSRVTHRLSRYQRREPRVRWRSRPGRPGAGHSRTSDLADEVTRVERFTGRLEPQCPLFAFPLQARGLHSASSSASRLASPSSARNGESRVLVS